jgi:phospholipid/cholesterol/gamma-HCH transport system substrate-binding protein
MAQRKQLSWTELRVGLFVLVGLFILAVAIFYVTGVTVFGPKYRLLTYLPEVDDLGQGAPVSLDGVTIGNVESIHLNPKPQNRMQNVQVVMRIDKKYQEEIRTDSSAKLITTGLLGNRYVGVERGLTGTILPNNGVIPGKEEAAMKQMVERGADLMQNLGALSNDVRDIVAQIQRGNGTLGKMMNDPSLYNHLNETATRLQAVATSIQSGEGTLGRLVTSDELYTKANATIGHVEDITAAVRDQKGTLGKLVYDPSMYENAKGFLEKGNATLADVRAGKGTLGKLTTDETLYNNLRDASANVRDASAKLNSNQNSMGKFFSDPAFYDNLTGATADLRLLLSDFRQNPKKFLHVKLAIF